MLMGIKQLNWQVLAVFVVSFFSRPIEAGLLDAILPRLDAENETAKEVLGKTLSEFSNTAEWQQLKGWAFVERGAVWIPDPDGKKEEERITLKFEEIPLGRAIAILENYQYEHRIEERDGFVTCWARSLKGDVGYESAGVEMVRMSKPVREFLDQPGGMTEKGVAEKLLKAGIRLEWSTHRGPYGIGFGFEHENSDQVRKEPAEVFWIDGRASEMELLREFIKLLNNGLQVR